MSNSNKLSIIQNVFTFYLDFYMTDMLLIKHDSLSLLRTCWTGKWEMNCAGSGDLTALAISMQQARACHGSSAFIHHFLPWEKKSQAHSTLYCIHTFHRNTKKKKLTYSNIQCLDRQLNHCVIGIVPVIKKCFIHFYEIHIRTNKYKEKITKY